jgi:hypothetical protein
LKYLIFIAADPNQSGKGSGTPVSLRQRTRRALLICGDG